MASPKTAIEVPFDPKISGEDGQINRVWLEAFGTVFQAAAKLREAAEGMAELDPSTATASDCANAWETFRATLQEIV